MPRPHRKLVCSATGFEGSLRPDRVLATSDAVDAPDPLCCAEARLWDEPIPKSCNLHPCQIACLGAVFHNLGGFFIKAPCDLVCICGPYPSWDTCSWLSLSGPALKLIRALFCSKLFISFLINIDELFARAHPGADPSGDRPFSSWRNVSSVCCRVLPVFVLPELPGCLPRILARCWASGGASGMSGVPKILLPIWDCRSILGCSQRGGFPLGRHRQIYGSNEEILFPSRLPCFPLETPSSPQQREL